MMKAWVCTKRAFKKPDGYYAQKGEPVYVRNPLARQAIISRGDAVGPFETKAEAADAGRSPSDRRPDEQPSAGPSETPAASPDEQPEVGPDELRERIAEALEADDYHAMRSLVADLSDDPAPSGRDAVRAALEALADG